MSPNLCVFLLFATLWAPPPTGDAPVFGFPRFQEARESQPPPAPGTTPPGPGEKGIVQELSLGAFAANIGGVAIKGDGLSENIGYYDLFRSGGGFQLLWRFHLPLIRRPRRELTIAPALLLDYRAFQGRTFTDKWGNTWAPDDLTLLQLLGGPCLRLFFRRFFLGARISLGVARIDGLDARRTDSLGNPVEGELYEPTTALAGQVSFRLGWIGSVGPRMALGCVGFVALQIVGPPGAGDDAEALALRDPHADTIISWSLGIAFTLEFGSGPRP